MRFTMTLSSVALLGALFLPCAAHETDAPPRAEANLLVDVSARLLNRAIQESVDRTAPVDETIQETPIHGIGRALGVVRAELVPDTRSGVIDIVFQGCHHSQTVGEQANVFIYTTTATSLNVRRRITIDGNGIRTCAGPAHGDAFATLLGIKSRTWPERLTEHLAKRVYDQSVDAAEAESGHKTAQQVAARLEEAVSPQLASLSQSVGRELKANQQSKFALQSLDFRTSAAALQARLRFKTPVNSPPSGALPTDTDLGIRLHESLVNHAAQVEVGGRSFRLDELLKAYNDATRGLMRDGRKAADAKLGLDKLEKMLAGLAGQLVTITLAKQSPLTVAFADQGFSVEIRIASVRLDKSLYSGLSVRAVYRFENAADGIHAVRQGPAKVAPFAEPGDPPTKLEPLPAAIRLLEGALFNEIFAERLTLALPALPLPEMAKGVRLQAPQAYARDGWLGVAWKLAAR